MVTYIPGTKHRTIRNVIPSFFYRLLFYVLAFLVLVLACITPADLIYQSVRNKTLSNVVSFAAVLVLTAVVCLLLWATRLYTNRAVLRAIPKDYVAVDKGDVPKKVRKMIEREWRRCARVAFEGRPRDVRGELEELERAEKMRDEEQRRGRKHNHHHMHLPSLPSTHGHEHALDNFGASTHGRRDSTPSHPHHHLRAGKPTASLDPNDTIPLRTAASVWGPVAVPGWSLGPQSAHNDDGTLAPAKPVQYHTVIRELPHLLEARAVSLAPATAAALSSSSSTISGASSSVGTVEAAAPDPRLVTLLQRRRGAGLREYAVRLLELGAVREADAGYIFDFANKYEYARFAPRALAADEFDALLSSFAELLNCMQLDLDKLMDVANKDFTEEDFDDDGSSRMPTETESDSSFRLSTSEDDSDSVLIG